MNTDVHEVSKRDRLEKGSHSRSRAWSARTKLVASAAACLVVAGLAVVVTHVRDDGQQGASSVGPVAGTALADPPATMRAGGSLPVGDWLLLASPVLDNKSTSTLHIKSVTADVPPSWKVVDTRAYRYAQLGGWPLAWPQTAVGAHGDPTSVKSTPVDKVDCPPSTYCPYYLMVKVVPSMRGDFQFGGMDVTYEIDGVLYSQHLDVLFEYTAT